MAHQRRSERPGHHDCRDRGGRRLGSPILLLTALLALAACDAPGPAAPRTDGSIEFPAGTAADDGSDGSDGGGSTTLVGLWQRFEVVEFETDIVTTTIRWEFEGLGTCRRTIVTFSAVEGFPRTTARDCSWDIGPLEVTITFADGESGTFSLDFPGFDPDRMLLDGAEYRRVR